MKYLTINNIAYIIVFFAIGSVLYTFAEPTITQEQIEARRHQEMINSQKDIDKDNLRTITDCHDYSLSKSKYPEEYIKLRSACYEKWKKPDIFKDKKFIYASGSGNTR